jgi:hypothetical protein
MLMASSIVHSIVAKATQASLLALITITRVPPWLDNIS